MKRLLAITLGVALAGLGTAALASRNSSGSYTVTASGTYPFVTGTVINSTTMNSIFSDLSTEMTDSVSRTGKGPMLAPLKLTNGSVTAPAITFNLETGTGFYRIGTNDVGLTVGGTKRWEHTASGMTETGWATFASTVTTPFVASSGANLSLVAPSTFDLELSGSTTVGFVVKADGTNDNKSRRLVNVADPTSAQDADTQNARDVAIAAAVGLSASVSAGANWTQASLSRAKKNGPVVMLAWRSTALNSSASYTSVATASVGSRPAVTIDRIPCSIYEAATGKAYPALCSITSGGVVSVTYYFDYDTTHAMTATLRTIAANDTVEIYVSYSTT